MPRASRNKNSKALKAGPLLDTMEKNFSDKVSPDDLRYNFDSQTQEYSCGSSSAGASDSAEDLIKIIGPPPGLGFAKNDQPAELQYCSEESTTDASGSGDETRVQIADNHYSKSCTKAKTGNLKNLLNRTPLPHTQHAQVAAAPQNADYSQASEERWDEWGVEAAFGEAPETMHSSQKRLSRAHHRPRVKKESVQQQTDRPFAPLTRSSRTKASVPANDTGTRTRLSSNAKAFQPLPFMPMSSVQAAWKSWEQKMSTGMPCNGSWQDPRLGQQAYREHVWSA